MSNRVRARVLVLAVSAIAVACTQTPTSPALFSDGIVSSKLVDLAVTGTTPVSGGSSQFHAIGTFAGGTTADVTSAADWRTSDAAIATVSSSGLVTGVAGGAVAITAAYQGRTIIRTGLVSGRGNYLAFVSD